MLRTHWSFPPLNAQPFALVVRLRASRGTRSVVVRAIEPVSLLVSASVLSRGRDFSASLPILRSALRSLKPEAVVTAVAGTPQRCVPCSPSFLVLLLLLPLS